MSRSRRLRTQYWSPLQMRARKPSHFGSNDQPRPVGSGPGFASIGAGGRATPRVVLLSRRKRESLERNGDWVAVAQISDDREAVPCTDETSASTVVDHGLVWLKVRQGAEPDLQELRARDGVQSERVHAANVRQGSEPSFQAAVLWPLSPHFVSLSFLRERLTPQLRHVTCSPTAS